MILILAITRARDAKRAGVDAVAVKSLAAVVTRRKSAPRITERALETQAAALSALEKRGLSFLPVRFGTVVRDADELQRLISPMSAQLQRALALTRGRRQMTVRVRGARPKTPRTTGRAFLAARAREARLPEADPLRRAVAGIVVAEQTGPARGPYRGSVYHLIDERDVQSYIDAVASLEKRRPGRLVVSGPMPPFAFTAVADIAGDA